MKFLNRIFYLNLLLLLSTNQLLHSEYMNAQNVPNLAENYYKTLFNFVVAKVKKDINKNIVENIDNLINKETTLFE